MGIENTKIAELLGSLNEEEMERLGVFLNSPYFNTSSQMTKMFGILRRHHPAFESITREEIYSEFYGSEPYKDKRVRDLFSRLLELCHDFLAQCELEKKVHTKKKLTLEQLYVRELENSFNSVIKDARKKLYASGILDEEYFMTEYYYSRVENDLYFAIESNKRKKSMTDYEDRDIYHFTNYALYRFLLYAILNFSGRFSSDKRPEYDIIKIIINYFNSHPPTENPTIYILYNIMLLDKEETDRETYEKVIGLLEEHKDKISASEKRTVFVTLYNYCTVQYSRGNSFFRAEHYRLLKYSVEHELYPREGKYFSDTSYISVASTATIRKDYEWAEQFIEKYRFQLRPDPKENAYTYCKGQLNFRLKNYDEALKFLSKVSIASDDYQGRVTNLRLRIHFEKGDFEICTNIIDSCLHFLSRSKVLTRFKKVRNSNFLHFTRRVLNVHLGGDRKNLYEIRKDLQAMAPEEIENRVWLLEQIDKMQI